MEEWLTAHRKRLNNAAEVKFEHRLNRETHPLLHHTKAALRELGELDTPERQKKARLINARLEEEVQKLREHLARLSEAAFDEGFARDSHALRQDHGVALKELGRLDSPETIQEAQHLGARMEEGINRLKNQHARRLDTSSSHRSHALTDFLDNRGKGDAEDRLAQRVDDN